MKQTQISQPIQSQVFLKLELNQVSGIILKTFFNTSIPKKYSGFQFRRVDWQDLRRDLFHSSCLHISGCPFPNLSHHMHAKTMQVISLNYFCYSLQLYICQKRCQSYLEIFRMKFYCFQKEGPLIPVLLWTPMYSC